MHPLKDLELMEEILFEYSVCYFHHTNKIFPSDNTELHVDWIKVRRINCVDYDRLEYQYIKLAETLNLPKKVFNPMTMSPRNVSVVEKIIQMSHVPTTILGWPVGYDNLDAVVESNDLKDRIGALFVQKTEKALI